ncbi:ATP-binding cassette domain-containing protein [Methylomonas sp. HW2-6]|uniref:ATP-binding cassette domain-containing protein n=1 Tax=Methylomonas sp. HW2-6 TaxID=3376687 RepID=UPI004042CF64
MATSNPLHRLKQLMLAEREDIGSLLAYGVGIGLMSLATPIAVQALVNTIAFGALLQPLVVLTLILLVLLSFSNTLVALQFYVVEMLQRRLFVRLFGTSAQRLRNAVMSVRDHQYLPELANRFFDVVSLQKTAASLLLETLGYLLQTLIGMILLAFYHPLLLAFDLFLVAALYLILFVMGKRGIPTAIEQSKAKYAAAAWLENIAANPLLGKSRAGAEFVDQQTEKFAHHYLEACVAHFRILSRQNIGALVLHTLANTALLGMGGWMVIERQLSLGQLIAAELVVNAMVYGLTRLGKNLDNFYELVASVDKIGYLLDLPQETAQDGQPEITESAYRLEIRQLCLPDSPYCDGANGLDLLLAAGDKLAISTGAERGSLLDTICGLRTPSAGQILLNGHDLRDLNLGQLRDHVSLVRHTELVEATIAENLSLGRDLPLVKLRQALEQVGLLETVSALPEGMQTELCPQGGPLNDEQALRLTLARAIAGNPNLLLIDKALDRIDTRYLPVLLEALTAPNAPWTLLVISHEPLVLAHFRRQVMLADGRLVENDTKGE